MSAHEDGGATMSPELEYTQAEPKPLHTEFTRDGMRHVQIRREGNVAMFRLDTGGVEVVRVRVAKPQKLPNGTFAPWRETYPSNEEFGRHGWYFMPQQRVDADAKFEQLKTDAHATA